MSTSRRHTAAKPAARSGLAKPASTFAVDRQVPAPAPDQFAAGQPAAEISTAASLRLDEVEGRLAASELARGELVRDLNGLRLQDAAREADVRTLGRQVDEIRRLLLRKTGLAVCVAAVALLASVAAALAAFGLAGPWNR